MSLEDRDRRGSVTKDAVEAAVHAYMIPRMHTNEALGGVRANMTAALEAAMPHIREDIAKGLQEIGEVWYEFDEETAMGLRYAAEIVRQTD